MIKSKIFILIENLIVFVKLKFVVFQISQCGTCQSRIVVEFESQFRNNFVNLENKKKIQRQQNWYFLYF